MTGIPPLVPDHSLLRCIGRGSYGEVWLAQNVMGVWRAVKVVLRASFDHDHPYNREFAGIQKYEPISRSHSGLMPILHIGHNEAAGYFYYVMELADGVPPGAEEPEGRTSQPPSSDAGHAVSPSPTARDQRAQTAFDPFDYRPQTLSSHAGRGRRLPVAVCVEVGLSLAGALAHLHRAGLVHRDVKPSNVIFVNSLPKLADIGLVTNANATLSCFVGTDGFVPPQGAGSEQADLFALGKTLYEISTGLDRFEYPRLPENLGEFADRDDLCELSAVLERACHPKPDARYRSAEELQNELLLLRARKSVRQLRRLERWRRRTVIIIGALVLLAAFGYGGRRVAQNRAAEAKGALLIAEAEAIRLGEHRIGWSTNAWNLIQQASHIRPDPSSRVYGASTLAGLDVRLTTELVNMGASSVAWGPGGASLLVGGTNDGTKLLDLQHGSLSVAHEPARGPVGFRADGTPLQLTRAGPGEVVLRHGTTSAALASFPLPPRYALTNGLLAMTPNGSTVAAAVATPEGAAEIIVWTGATPVPSACLDWPATSLGLDAEGRLLASGNRDGCIRVWSLPDARIVQSMRHDRTPVTAVALCRSPSAVTSESPPLAGWRLAVGHAGGKAALWELETGTIAAHVSGLEFGVNALAFSSDGTLLCAGGDYRIWVTEATSGRCLLRLFANGSVRGLAFAADDSSLACAADTRWQPGGTYAWQLQNGRGITTLRGLATSVTCVAFAPTGDALAALSHDWRVAIWAPRSGRLLRLLEVPIGVSADNAALAFSADGAQFFFCAGTEAKLWDIASGRELGSWPLPLGIVDIASLPERGRILLFRDEQSELERAPAPSNSLLLQPRACRLRELRVPHEVRLKAEITNFAQRVYGTWAAPNGAWFAAQGRWGDKGTTNGAVMVFEGSSGRPLWAIPWREPEGADSSVVWIDPASESLILTLRDGPRAPRRRLLVDVLSNTRTPLPDHDSTPLGNDRFYRTFLHHGKRKLSLAVTEGRRLTPYVTLDLSALGCLTDFGNGVVGSPDGTLLATGTTAGPVLVFDLAEIHRRVSTLPAER